MAGTACEPDVGVSTEARVAFDHYAQGHSRHAPPGYRIEVLPHLSRLIPLAPGSDAYVMFARLPDALADALIAAEISHFDAMNQCFEWKWHAFDRPVNLAALLRGHGFVADEAEALMVLRTDGAAAAALAGAAACDAAVIRRLGIDIDVSEGVRAAVALQEQVWGRRFAWLEADLRAAFADRATAIDVVLACVGDETVGSGWRVGPAGSLSADLHGGALLPQWRGRGIYSALLRARVEMARAQGIQSLHVDAAPMSRPILQRKGFEFICDTVPYHRPTP
jgi:GNAT superfamily N-acetyltransferase